MNISVREKGSTQLNNRTEIKHIMTFSGVAEAIDFEFKRQVALLTTGNMIRQETRGFDEKTRSTYTLRDKEDSVDYRFMPEPDLLPVPVTRQMVEAIRADMKEDLDVREERLRKEYGLSDYTTNVLMDEPGAVEYFEQVEEGIEGESLF